MDTEEAIRRVKQIIPKLRDDVKTAVLSHAAMEATNGKFRGLQMGGIWSEFVDTYNAVQNALALKLAMDVARIFDISNRPLEKQDQASVLVLAKLLERQDVRERLKHHAEAITNFLNGAKRVRVAGSEDMEALRRVREFRNRRLAHNLFDKEPDALPRYSDLDILLEIAKDATKQASLAIEGLNVDFNRFAKNCRENGEGYAACLLDGLKRAALAKIEDDRRSGAAYTELT